MRFSLDHVQLAMPQGRESDAREFYGSLLGLPEIEKPDSLKSRGGVWFLLDDARQVHLGVEEPFRPSAKAHPCFLVGDLPALADRLHKAGFQTKYDDLLPPRRRFYSVDCFGNRLEFAERRTSD
ncbi:MAG TPA: hypothetical protein VK797_16895 [Tepidisphaeraceae bacterium]|jgi:catechol 2,3-dioxygenase-like lactoylglutathione lyase family enzyme|nr:hypothetical protein [Tepidisphaeraceae bacterium]